MTHRNGIMKEALYAMKNCNGISPKMRIAKMGG